jgi:MFS transporter, DHA2 family, multidrug resistance protein
VTWAVLRKRETPIAKIRIDGVGLGLLVVGVSTLQMMLDLGKDRDWFNSSFILALGLIALVSLSFLVVWELTEKEPVVDLSLFKDPNFALGVLITSLGFMAFFASVVIFPLWLQTVMNYTAGFAGIATAPAGVLAVIFTPLVGRYIHKTDPRLMACFAFCVFAGVSLWNAGFTLDEPFAKMLPPRFLQGVGIAFFFVPMMTITLSRVPDSRLASASGLSNFMRTLSGAIGTAISTTYWENNAIKHHAMLADSVSNYAQATQDYQASLQQLGVTGQASTEQINQVVTQMGLMMSTNDFFHLSALSFLVLAGLVWVTSPRRGVAAATGH